MTSRGERIAGAFGDARAYDAHAVVQRRVAARLARRIAALPEGERRRVLELGCGTGFLAAALPPLPPGGDWLMTDIAPAMLERSRARFAGRDGFRFALLDAAAPAFAGREAPFDLICSSLALQWLDDLPGALERLFRLLRPGGRLLIATLAEGTFAEWRAAHADLGLVAGTPEYPAPATLRAIRLDGTAGTIEMARFTCRYPDAAHFLRAVKAIGAGTPRPGHIPLDAATMRAVLRRFDRRGREVSYHVAFCAFTRP